MAIVRVRYLVLLKTRLAEAIFGQKIIRVVLKAPVMSVQTKHLTLSDYMEMKNPV